MRSKPPLRRLDQPPTFVLLNGPEPAYASEKLGHALSKAAEGLALCDVELEEVADEARRGHLNGRLIREELR